MHTFSFLLLENFTIQFMFQFVNIFSLLLCPSRGAAYCDQLVCVSVCLSVHEHISGTAGPIFTNAFVQIPCGCGSVLRF